MEFNDLSSAFRAVVGSAKQNPNTFSQPKPDTAGDIIDVIEFKGKKIVWKEHGGKIWLEIEKKVFPIVELEPGFYRAIQFPFMIRQSPLLIAQEIVIQELDT